MKRKNILAKKLLKWVRDYFYSSEGQLALDKIRKKIDRRAVARLRKAGHKVEKIKNLGYGDCFGSWSKYCMGCVNNEDCRLESLRIKNAPK